MAREKARKAPPSYSAEAWKEAPLVREARVEFRATRDQKALIEQAARLRGEAMTDFVRSTVLERAREEVESATLTLLFARDWEIFLRILGNESPPNETLLKAKENYGRLIRASEGL